MPKRYWFPAKRYGWGWGPPTAWQGWMVMAVFVVLAGGGAVVMLPRFSEWLYAGYSFVLCVLLLVVCWITGERPRWRWGDEAETDRSEGEAPP